jgi:DNA-binding winged helix-turn-helix (wHTH) protein/tetratricopeptide (TPR) repeat protein
MAAPRPAPSAVRFGVFEVDLKAGELRRQGMRIKLQDQPFQVLAVLIEHAGEVVSKEVLRQRIWPADTFVDFDHALHSAIARLREALGDSSESPRFVETLPRRGYRLIVPIQTISEETEAEAPAALAPSPGPTEAPKPSGDTLHRFAISLLAGLLGGALLLALVVGADVGGARRWLLRKTNPGVDSRAVLPLQNVSGDTILIGDFSNSTDDSVFDDTLKTALTVALRQSPFLNILSDDRIATTLKLMVQPTNTKLTPQVAREVCERAGSKVYVAGSIARLGNEYVLALKAVNCQTGDTIAEEQLTASRKENVLNAVGEGAARLRSRLGESLSSVQKFNVPLEQATTSSLEALRAFSMGVKAFRETGSNPVSYFQRAVGLDPNFATGYYALGSSYDSLGEMDRARQYKTRAFQLRGHASEREQLLITGSYYADVTGEVDKAVQACEETIQSYPHDDATYFELGGLYDMLGRYDRMAELMERAQQLIPDKALASGTVAIAELALQREDRARQLVHDAHLQKLDSLTFSDLLYALAFLAGDSAGMAERQQWYASKPEYESTGLSLASDTEAYAGRARKARAFTRRAMESGIRADDQELAAVWRSNGAIRDAAFGYFAEARHSAAAALKLAPTSQGVGVETALAYAMAGDSAQAQFLAQEIIKRYPLDTQVQSLWLPAIRAQLALNRKDPAEAISSLQSLSPPMEYGQIVWVENMTCLYPTYIRGQAYLAAGQGKEAAAEFQKILDHSGIVWNCWTGALARLGVARADALQAKNATSADAARTRTLAAYKDFLTLWQGADPDIPIYKEAKAEYAKLQ